MHVHYCVCLKHVYSTVCTCVRRLSLAVTRYNAKLRGRSQQLYAHFFGLFQVAFSLLVAFLTSLEGCVMEMKPATLALRIPW